MTERILNSQSFKLNNLAVLFVLCTPLLVFSLMYPEDWAGWLLAYISVSICLLSKSIRNRVLFLPFLTQFFIQQIVAFINSYVLIVPGGDADALRFHTYASEISRIGNINLLNVGSVFFDNFLALFYYIFQPSMFFASQIVLFAFTLSTLTVIKICNYLNLDVRQIRIIILLFTLLPSTIFFTSVPLREPFQILFFLNACYFSLKLKQEKQKLDMFKILINLLALGILHNGLLAFTPFFSLIIYAWVFMKPEINIKNIASIMFALIVALAIIQFLSLGIVSSDATDALLSGESAEYASTYRTSNLDARAAYGVELDVTSLGGIIRTVPLIFFFYMFSPLPWQVGNVMDVVGLIESGIRIILLFYAFMNIRLSVGLNKSIVRFLLIMYLFMQFMWSLGTLNWGTAMRHHIVAFPLLVIVGIQGYNKIKLKKKASKSRNVRSTY